MKCVQSVCCTEVLTYPDTTSLLTTHGLRGTLATFIFEAGHSYSSVSLGTGHWDAKSLKSYRHLRLGEGNPQQDDFLCGLDYVKKMKVSTNSKTQGLPTSQYQLLSGVPFFFANIGSFSGNSFNFPFNVNTAPADQDSHPLNVY